MDFVCVCKYNWILIILRACISSFQLSLSVSAWLWNVNLALCIMLCLMSSAGTPDFCFNVNRNIHKTFDQLLQVACCLFLKNYTITQLCLWQFVQTFLNFLKLCCKIFFDAWKCEILKLSPCSTVMYVCAFTVKQKELFDTI